MSYARRSRRARRPRAGVGSYDAQYGVGRGAMTVLPAPSSPSAPRMEPGAHVTLGQPWKGVRALSGVSSRPSGAPVHRGALGDGPPQWYTALYGASLGDDIQQATPTILNGPAEWQSSMLSQVSALNTSLQTYTTKDMWARYAQIAATLSIPLAAALWRMLFRAGRSDGT